MKIVIAIPTIKPGGAEKQAALLAASLNKDNEVHFFSFNGMKNHSERVLTILKNANGDNKAFPKLGNVLMLPNQKNL